MGTINQEESNNPLLSRKFVFLMLVVIFGFVLVLTGKTTADNFFQFVEIIGGTYIAGNVIEGISDNMK